MNEFFVLVGWLLMLIILLCSTNDINARISNYLYVSRLSLSPFMCIYYPHATYHPHPGQTQNTKYMFVCMFVCGICCIRLYKANNYLPLHKKLIRDILFMGLHLHIFHISSEHAAHTHLNTKYTDIYLY